MDKIVWNDEVFSVGHALMDQHHQQLVAYINQLMELLDQPQPDEVEYLRILSAVGEYVDLHFTVEEELLRRAEYPDLEFHHQQHSGYADKIGECIALADVGQIVFVTEFLERWLLKHILAEDMNSSFGVYFSHKSNYNNMIHND